MDSERDVPSVEVSYRIRASASVLVIACRRVEAVASTGRHPAGTCITVGHVPLSRHIHGSQFAEPFEAQSDDYKLHQAPQVDEL
jgi:hypothetical protein